MARHRVHSLDDLLDMAEQLVISEGPTGLTVRGLAISSEAPVGTIYHAFSSKEELLARLWLRATERLGAIMEDAVRSICDGELSGGLSGGLARDAAPRDAAPRDAAARDAAARDAVVAVALAPAVLAHEYRASAQLFFAQRSDQLFSLELPAEVLAELEGVQARFNALLVSLASAIWKRSDRAAVEVIAACVVDIPGGLLRRRLLEGRTVGPATERRIETAVRAILADPLEPAPERRRSG